MIRRIISLSVVAVMGLSLLPSALADELTDTVFTSSENVLSEKSEAFVELSAAGTKYGSYLYYKINDEEITITGCDTSAAGELKIPAEINGLPVTCIGDYAFSGCVGLTNIIIPYGVTSIGTIEGNGYVSGKGAFHGCVGLTSVTIPDSVISIGDEAFYGCIGLTNVIIPNSVINIGCAIFYDCTGLTSVKIGSCVTSINYKAFSGCTALETVTIKDSESEAGENYNFQDCSVLKSIEYMAFGGCTSLKQINIPDSVSNIDNYAFYKCSALTDLYVYV